MSAGAQADRLRRAVGVLGEVLITAGVVVGLFAVYTLFWTGVQTQSAQEELQGRFEATDGVDEAPSTPDADEAAGPSDEAAEPPAPARADAYARLTIPRLGEEWAWIVVDGVDLDTLTLGPGHYPSSAAPGEVGNFAVAGHRATYGEPFAYLDRLQVGDAIVVEREGQTYTYAVTESFITDPSDTGVLLAVPGDAEAAPDEAVLTLTTCHPRWGSSERLIVHGELVSTGGERAEA